MVQLVEVMVNLVRAPKDVRVAVVTVFEIVCRTAGRVVVPLLLDDSAKAVEAGVLVAAVAAAPCSDVP
jgi:hypothetical protein